MAYDSPGGASVLVAPRDLAGAPGTNPVRTLLEAATGWSRALVGAEAYYTSPCQRLRAAASPVKGWTFAYAADPSGVRNWIISFNRWLADEIVSTFSSTLVEGVENYFPRRPAPHRNDARQPLCAARMGARARATVPAHALARRDAAFEIRTAISMTTSNYATGPGHYGRITAGPDRSNDPRGQRTSPGTLRSP